MFMDTSAESEAFGSHAEQSPHSCPGQHKARAPIPLVTWRLPRGAFVAKWWGSIGYPNETTRHAVRGLFASASDDLRRSCRAISILAPHLHTRPARDVDGVLVHKSRCWERWRCRGHLCHGLVEVRGRRILPVDLGRGPGQQSLSGRPSVSTRVQCLHVLWLRPRRQYGMLLRHDGGRARGCIDVRRPALLFAALHVHECRQHHALRGRHRHGSLRRGRRQPCGPLKPSLARWDHKVLALRIEV
jgi:hypothetical protein